MSYIAKFNPYQMDDKTILSVATGRKTMLSQVLKTLEKNLEPDSTPQHMLIRGPRGMGKSFFLKYLEINFKSKSEFRNSNIILLPEEQNNINSPSDFIKLILTLATGGSARSIITSWEEAEETWQKELQKLKDFIAGQKEKFEKYILVVVAENIDELLQNIQRDSKTRKIYESRFRHILEHLDNFILIGATTKLEDGIDRKYDNRLFHIFKRCRLTRWKEEDYFNYFERRKQLKIEQTGVQFSLDQEDLMKAKLKAISQFTGGSPRMAVVLTDLLLEDNVLSTANTLFGLIDDLTPYYQDLTKNIPPKSRMLFDTLIRKEENLSQSQVAELLNATQSKISKAFGWLVENGYIIGKKRSDSPAFLYSVADRIYVLYYLQREVYHNENYSPIWLLSDFLVAFYQKDELRNHAIRFLRDSPGRESMDLAKVYMLSAGVEKDELPDFDTPEEWSGVMEDVPEYGKLRDEINVQIEKLENYLEKENEEEFLEEFKKDVDKVVLLIEKSSFNIVSFLVKLKNLLVNLSLHTNSVQSTIYFVKKVSKIKHLDKHRIFLGNLKFMHGFVLATKFKFNNSNILLENSFKIFKECNDFTGQITSLAIQSLNLRSQQKYIDAVSKLELARDIFPKLEFKIIKGKDFKQGILGDLGELYILTERIEKALELLNPSSKQNEKIFRKFSGAIILLNKEDHAKAFSTANQLIIALKERQKWMDTSLALSYFFANLLKENISNNLLQEICEEALSIFTKQEEQIIIQAALKTTQYLESGKAATYLEKLSPDMAIAVEAIVKEAEL